MKNAISIKGEVHRHMVRITVMLAMGISCIFLLNSLSYAFLDGSYSSGRRGVIPASRVKPAKIEKNTSLKNDDPVADPKSVIKNYLSLNSPTDSFDLGIVERATALSNAEPNVTQAITDLASAIEAGDNEAIALVAQVALSSPNELQVAAAKALRPAVEAGSPTAVPVLAGLLNNPDIDVYVKIAAIDSLTPGIEQGDPIAIGAGAAVAHNKGEEEEVRVVAVQALAKGNTQEARNALFEIASLDNVNKGESLLVLEAAFNGLGLLAAGGDQEAAGRLKYFADHEEFGMASFAKDALPQGITQVSPESETFPHGEIGDGTPGGEDEIENPVTTTGNASGSYQQPGGSIDDGRNDLLPIAEAKNDLREYIYSLVNPSNARNVDVFTGDKLKKDIDTLSSIVPGDNEAIALVAQVAEISPDAKVQQTALAALGPAIEQGDPIAIGAAAAVAHNKGEEEGVRVVAVQALAKGNTQEARNALLIITEKDFNETNPAVLEATFAGLGPLLEAGNTLVIGRVLRFARGADLGVAKLAMDALKPVADNPAVFGGDGGLLYIAKATNSDDSARAAYACATLKGVDNPEVIEGLSYVAKFSPFDDVQIAALNAMKQGSPVAQDAALYVVENEKENPEVRVTAVQALKSAVEQGNEKVIARLQTVLANPTDNNEVKSAIISVLETIQGETGATVTPALVPLPEDNNQDEHRYPQRE